MRRSLAAVPVDLPGCYSFAAVAALVVDLLEEPGVSSAQEDEPGKCRSDEIWRSNQNPIPANYGGIPVNQEVVDTEYGDTGDISVVSF